MADSEAQNLTELTAPAAADVCYIVDDPAGTPLARKVQVYNLVGYLVTTAGDILYATAARTLARLGIGTAGQVFVTNSGATAPAWATISPQVFLSAAAGVPKTTGGCAAAAQTEMATNKQNVKTLDFDTTTEEHADWTFILPSDYGGGTMTAKFVWMHAATTTNFGVVWGIAGICYADGDAMDAAVGTEVMVTDTGGTTTDVYISPATAAITWAGTPAAGQLINLTVARKPGEAGDTLAIDARLLGVQLTYTRS